MTDRLSSYVNVQNLIKVWEKQPELVGEYRVPKDEFPETLFLFLTDTEWGIQTLNECLQTGLDSTIADWVRSAKAMVDDPDAYVGGDEYTAIELTTLGFPNNITIDSIREWMLSQ